MTVKNMVTGGDYKGYIAFQNKKKGLYIYGAFGLGKKIYINKTTVEAYDVINQENSVSMGSAVARGILGGAIAGTAGAVAGAVSAKTKGIYSVSIKFKDGTKCLCDLDEAMFKNLVVVMY